MSKRPVAIVTGPRNADFKNPLLKTLLPINVAQSPNIRRKSQVDATKTFLICEKHCFEKNAFEIGEKDFTQFLMQLTRNCISKQNISSIKIYLTPKYSYTRAIETS